MGFVPQGPLSLARLKVLQKCNPDVIFNLISDVKQFYALKRLSRIMGWSTPRRTASRSYVNPIGSDRLGMLS